MSSSSESFDDPANLSFISTTSGARKSALRHQLLTIDVPTPTPPTPPTGTTENKRQPNSARTPRERASKIAGREQKHKANRNHGPNYSSKTWNLNSSSSSSSSSSSAGLMDADNNNNTHAHTHSVPNNNNNNHNNVNSNNNNNNNIDDEDDDGGFSDEKFDRSFTKRQFMGETITLPVTNAELSAARGVQDEGNLFHSHNNNNQNKEEKKVPKSVYDVSSSAVSGPSLFRSAGLVSAWDTSSSSSSSSSASASSSSSSSFDGIHDEKSHFPDITPSSVSRYAHPLPHPPASAPAVPFMPSSSSSSSSQSLSSFIGPSSTSTSMSIRELMSARKIHTTPHGFMSTMTHVVAPSSNTNNNSNVAQHANSDNSGNGNNNNNNNNNTTVNNNTHIVTILPTPHMASSIRMSESMDRANLTAYELKKEISALHREMDFIREEWDAVSAEHEPCAENRAKMEAQIKALTLANERLKSHAEQTEAAMVSAVQEKEKLQEEFSVVHQRMVDERVSSRSSTASYLADKLEYEEKYRALERTTTELKREATTFHSLHAQLSEKVEKSSASYDSLVRQVALEREAHRTALDDCSTTVSKLRHERQRMLTELEDVQKQGETLKEQLKEAQKQAMNAEDERDAKVRVIVQQQAEINKLSASLQVSQLSLARLEVASVTSTSLIAQQNDQLAQLHDQVATLTQANQVATEERSRNEFTIKMLTKERDEQASTFNAELSAAKSSIESLQSSMSALRASARSESELRMIEGQLAAKEASARLEEISELKATVSVLEKEVNDKEASLEYAMKQVNKVQGEWEAEIKKRKEGEEKLKTYTSTLKHVREKMKAFKSAHSNCASIKSTVAEQVVELDKKREEIMNLKYAHSLCATTIEGVNAELQSVKREHARCGDLQAEVNRLSSCARDLEVERRTSDLRNSRISELTVELRQLKQEHSACSSASQVELLSAHKEQAAEIDRLKTKVIDTVEELHTVTEELAEMKKEHAKCALLKASNLSMTAELKTLKATSNLSERTKLSVRYDQLSEDYEKMKKANIERDYKLTALTAENSALNEQLKRAREDTNARTLQDELASLRSTYAALESEFHINDRALKSSLASLSEYRRTEQLLNDAIVDAKTRFAKISAVPSTGLTVTPHPKRGMIVEEVGAGERINKSAVCGELRKKDIIEAVNGQPIQGKNDWKKLTKKIGVGDIIVMQTTRGPNTHVCVSKMGAKGYHDDEVEMLRRMANTLNTQDLLSLYQQMSGATAEAAAAAATEAAAASSSSSSSSSSNSSNNSTPIATIPYFPLPSESLENSSSTSSLLDDM